MSFFHAFSALLLNSHPGIQFSPSILSFAWKSMCSVAGATIVRYSNVNLEKIQGAPPPPHGVFLLTQLIAYHVCLT